MVADTVSHDEIKKILSQYFDSISDVIRLKGGNDNENYSFISEKGKFVFRIYNEVLHKKRTENEILEEINFINFFHNHGITTPKVFADKEGNLITKIDNRFCAVFEFAKGKYVYDNLKATHFGQVGKLMGKIHKLTKDNQLKTEKLWQGKKIWEYLKGKVEATEDLGESNLQLFENIMKSVNLFENNKLLFTHNDYHFGNILFYEDQLTALLDFDGYSQGHFANDIARFFVADLAYTKASYYFHTQEFIDSFFNEYELQRTLTSDDKQLISLYIDIHYLLQLSRLKNFDTNKINEFIKQVEDLRKFYRLHFNKPIIIASDTH